jgi:hypothetical protein
MVYVAKVISVTTEISAVDAKVEQAQVNYLLKII